MTTTRGQQHYQDVHQSVEWRTHGMLMHPRPYPRSTYHRTLNQPGLGKSAITIRYTKVTYVQSCGNITSIITVKSRALHKNEINLYDIQLS